METREKTPKPLVLVIDDDPSITDVVEMALEQLGYETICCHTVDAAKAQVLKRSPDVVLVDSRIPGSNGAEFMSWFSKADGKEKLVLMSAAADIESIAARAGGVSFLRKPFSLDALEDTLRQRLEILTNVDRFVEA